MTKPIKYFFWLLLFFIYPLGALATNMDSVLKYAWGDKVGWINFNPSDGAVTVSDASLSGYAWSSNYGWINLSPTTSGVKNDSQGNLSGQAWSENLGWIDFGGVRINDGLFSGTASSTNAGTINFSCDHCAVKTAWRKATVSDESIGSSAIIPVYPQSAVINLPLNSNQFTISSTDLIVNIPLSGNSDVKGVSYSLTSDFTNASILPFENNLVVNICPAGNCSSGNYTIWLKFFSATGNSLPAQVIVVNYLSSGNNSCLDDREVFLPAEEKRAIKVNLNLSRNLSGRILLQVENRGRAWYVYPKNLTRYYLGCPQDAFKVMRDLSLGISNKSFSALTLKEKKRLSGLILLKVEDKGMAYYINPVDLKLYYLGRPDDARRIMRELALGISDNNLNQLKIGK